MSYLVLEADGTSRLTLEDGTGSLELETNTVFDALSTSGEFTTTDPVTWTHTPVASTVQGVYVGIICNSGADAIDGTVSYGGVALTRKEDETKAISEAGFVAVYFLGSSVPSGAQTVSISHTGSSVAKAAWCITFTATQDLDIVTTGTVSSGSTEDPQVALDTGSIYGLRMVSAFTGHGAISAHSPNTDWTEVGELLFSPAATTALTYRADTFLTGSVNAGYQSTGNDDSVMVVVAIQGASGATPGSVSVSAIVLAGVTPASTAKGAAKAALAAIVRSFTADAVVVKGSAKTQPSTIARNYLVLDATAIGSDPSATVTPGAIARAMGLAATTQVGSAVIQPSATARVFLVPQVIPKSPATQTPGAIARSVTLPVVTVQGKTLVQTGMSMTFTLPAPTLKGGSLLAPDSIDLAAVASQVTIVLEGSDGEERKFIDPVW